MSKMSGYSVTITAFLPANADDPETMVATVKIIRETVVAMHAAGFRGIEARPRYRTRADVPDSPEPEGGDAQSTKTESEQKDRSALDDGPVAEDRDGAALASVAERVAAGVADGDLDVPGRLRRKAGG